MNIKKCFIGHTCTRLGWGSFFWAAGDPEIVGSLRGGGGEAKSMMSSKASGDIDLQMGKKATIVKLMDCKDNYKEIKQRRQMNRNLKQMVSLKYEIIDKTNEPGFICYRSVLSK